MPADTEVGTCGQCGGAITRTPGAGRPPKWCSKECRWKASRAPKPRLVLNGDRHETVMTERRGLFRVICGCGWSSSDGHPDDAEHELDAHLLEVAESAQ